MNGLMIVNVCLLRLGSGAGLSPRADLTVSWIGDPTTGARPRPSTYGLKNISHNSYMHAVPYHTVYSELVTSLNEHMKLLMNKSNVVIYGLKNLFILPCQKVISAPILHSSDDSRSTDVVGGVFVDDGADVVMDSGRPHDSLDDGVMTSIFGR